MDSSESRSYKSSYSALKCSKGVSFFPLEFILIYNSSESPFSANGNKNNTIRSSFPTKRSHSPSISANLSLIASNITSILIIVGSSCQSPINQYWSINCSFIEELNEGVNSKRWEQKSLELGRMS